MGKIIKITVALMLILPDISGAEKSLGEFFEFSQTAGPSKELLSRIGEQPRAAVAFRTRENFIQVGGGYNSTDPVRTAIQYELHNGNYTADRLPDWPFPLSSAGVAISENMLYVVGQRSGTETNTALLQLNLSKPDTSWSVCPAPPELLSGNPVLTSLHGLIYVTGFGTDGSGAGVYNPVRNLWTSLASAQENMRGFIGISCGNDHLLFFNATRPDDRIIAYHRITDTWFEMGRLPHKTVAVGASSSGTEFLILTGDSVLTGKALLRPTKYGIYDHLVVALLVIALVAIGMFFSRKETSSGDYFRAGKRIPWWAAGLSLFACGASAISLMAMPGKSFAENWIYFSITLYIVLIQIPLVLLVYIPIARRLNICTANEYLERRFNLPIRMMGFVIFSLYQILARSAAILLLPAIAISAIFGLPIEQSILIMGVVSTIYVTLGGLEAVIWTDVLQAVVMLAAVFVCAIWACFSIDMTAPVAMEALSGLGKLRLFDFSFDWTAPVFLILFSNVIALSLGMIGDQTFIQRVQCTHDEKESRKAFLTQMAVAVPMNFVLFALGTLLFLFYRTRPECISPAMKADGIFPFFAAQHLPPGMAGFVVAALLAATMSTVSGAINSVANLGVEDVYRRFFPKATDRRCMVIGRTLTVSLGVFSTLAALLLAQGSLLSVWDLALMISGMVIAPVSGIFVLGIFTLRANSTGAWAGTVASILATVYAKLFLNLHAMAFLTVGVFTCIVVGYLASFLAPKSRKDLNGLTVFTLFKKKD